MKVKKYKSLIVMLLCLCLVAGCAGSVESVQDNSSSYEQEDADKDADKSGNEESDDNSSEKTFNGMYERPSLITKEMKTEEKVFTASVPEYEIASDLSNLYNLEILYCSDEEKEMLAQNGFVVTDGGGAEFFETYEFNRYGYVPNFITVDSLMHTYHLYFSYLLKNIEKNDISDALLKLSKKMMDNSINQYDALKGSEWENAALRNVVFFTVGAKLLDDSIDIIKNSDVNEAVQYELDAIYDAAGIYISNVTGSEEDYTQYKPRGYYDGDEQLEKYFRAMMWYGRMHFKQENEDLDRSAFLITKALMEDEESFKLWESIYAVTSFFAGASDDAGVCEYAQIIIDSYGEGVSYSDIIGNDNAFKDFHSLTKDAKVPQINSIPIWDGQNNIIPGFRFMGQRFTIDASVMQKLIYSAVKEDKDGNMRMLPDVLDFPAALGSKTAYEILKDTGVEDYPGYMENMEEIQKELSDESKALWSASLYASWLNTLRPLLNEDRVGYPRFMQSKEWIKKNLESFAGSYAELKHDTVLYSKQVLAEMGGGDDEEWDERGYVEPEPLVYSRFINLTRQTRDGLDRFGMLHNDAKEDLDKLEEIAVTMLTISEKELRDETLDPSEYEFIDYYGGYIEHFWHEYAKDAGGGSDDEWITSQEYPSAIITDIATDPNGTVLEIGTGCPATVTVIVKVDDKIKFARGSVYSFYQFEQPINERLTDYEWRRMLGIYQDYDRMMSGDYTWDEPNAPDKPGWTGNYRYVYQYNY